MAILSLTRVSSVAKVQALGTAHLSLLIGPIYTRSWCLLSPITARHWYRSEHRVSYSSIPLPLWLCAFSLCKWICFQALWVPLSNWPISPETDVLKQRFVLSNRKRNRHSKVIAKAWSSKALLMGVVSWMYYLLEWRLLKGVSDMTGPRWRGPKCTRS